MFSQRPNSVAVGWPVGSWTSWLNGAVEMASIGGPGGQSNGRALYKPIGFTASNEMTTRLLWAALGDPRNGVLMSQLLTWFDRKFEVSFPMEL